VGKQSQNHRAKELPPVHGVEVMVRRLLISQSAMLALAFVRPDRWLGLPGRVRSDNQIFKELAARSMAALY
jgi:hypothetical protein